MQIHKRAQSAPIKMKSKYGGLNTFKEPSAFRIESIQGVNIFKRHGRAILTDEQAQTIFRHKPTAFAQDRDKAGLLARLYGVSVKTVRDVWVGRTWYRATFHMGHTKPFAPERLQMKAGRPKGSKDSKPRPRKTQSDDSHSEPFLEQACNETNDPRKDVGVRHASDTLPVLAKEAVFVWKDVKNRSWTDFPMPIPSSIAFEDPFREDWEIALQRNEHRIDPSVRRLARGGRSDRSRGSLDC